MAFSFNVMSGDPDVIDPFEITTVVEVGASVVSPMGGWAVMTQVPLPSNRR